MNLKEYYYIKEKLAKQYEKKLKVLERERSKMPLKVLSDGVEYYCVNELLECEKRVFKDGIIYDMVNERNYNVFNSEEEAKFEIKRLKVYRGLRLFSTKYKEDSERFSIYYDSVSNKIEYVSTKNTNTKNAELLFQTEKDARDAVEFVGYDNVLKYYLDI